VAIAHALNFRSPEPRHASPFMLQLRRHAKFDVAEPIHYCRIVAFCC